MVPRNPLWTPEEDDKLRSLILSSKDIPTIAKRLNRTQRAIRGRAAKLKLPLKVVAVGLKAKGVPARPSHIPNHYERSALTKLASGRELPPSMLLPASRTTIAKLLKKGWIERAGSTQLYRITEAGKAALRAEM